MAKNSIRDYSATASQNTDIDSIDIDENCPASNLNNSQRALMAHLKNVSTGAVNLETPAADRLDVDNLRLDGNTISSTDTNGDITLDPNGTGDTIVASGNLGIGTSSPSGDGETIHINGSSANSTLHLTNTTTGSGVADGTYVTTSGNDFLLRNREAGNTLFYTSNATRMRIASGGEVNIGSASSVPNGANSQTRLTVRQNQGTDAVFIDRTADIDSNYRDLVRFARNGTTVGQIKARNNAVQYNTTSDARLKENVEDMTGAIDRVKTLKPKRYSWIGDELDAPNIDGFLAHEAQTVVPDAVSGTHNEVDDDGNPVMQGIDQSKLVPLLTGALQEAIAKIETLETEMTALKARVTALEA